MLILICLGVEVRPLVEAAVEGQRRTPGGIPPNGTSGTDARRWLHGRMRRMLAVVVKGLVYCSRRAISYKPFKSNDSPNERYWMFLH